MRYRVRCVAACALLFVMGFHFFFVLTSFLLHHCHEALLGGIHVVLLDAPSQMINLSYGVFGIHNQARGRVRASVHSHPAYRGWLGYVLFLIQDCEANLALVCQLRAERIEERGLAFIRDCFFCFKFMLTLFAFDLRPDQFRPRGSQYAVTSVNSRERVLQ